MSTTVWSAVTIALLATAPLAAQSWQPEMGLQGGFTKVKSAGTGANNFFTQLDLPGVSFGPLLPTPAALYFIAPVGARVALEPSVSAGILSEGSPFWFSFYQIGLRADYAVTRHLYGAAGVLLADISGISIGNGFQFGLQAAAGYRGHLAGPLQGRLEADIQTWGAKSGELRATDTYSVLFGISAALSHPSPPARTRTSAPAIWETSIGTSAGFVEVHIPGSDFEETAILLPGVGVGEGDFGVTTPSLYMTLPLGGKFALEPGLDVHRYHIADETITEAGLSTRLDYAFCGPWYGAVSGNTRLLQASARPSFAALGAGVAAGYRFHLSGAWNGRLELSHTIMGAQRTNFYRPLNSTAVTVGALATLR